MRLELAEQQWRMLSGLLINVVAQINWRSREQRDVAIRELFQKLVKDVAMFDDPNTGVAGHAG